MTQAAFQWECQPKAEEFVLTILQQALRLNSHIQELSNNLEKHTSTRLFDWLDHVVVASSPQLEKELQEAGFSLEQKTATYSVFSHLGAKLPRVVLKNEKTAYSIEIALIVESIPDFLNAHGFFAPIEGSPFSSYRRAYCLTENDVKLLLVERKGTLSIEPDFLSPADLEKYLLAEEKWLTRERSIDDEDEAMHIAIKIAEELIALIGKDRAASLILSVERQYWQTKNLAGQLQKNRQDRLGMGWANHDHHTFRSSRKRFHQLVKLFEMLGFHCRERYYAGKEAGWGAQVMENPRANLVLFLDVDLLPDELDIDFAHQPLPETKILGTIGLWTALHGDSILKSGMHHLEAQFLFEDLTKDLNHLGVGMMQPFSSFPFLKQAFTAGEVWTVDKKKVEKLFKEGKISLEQKEKFLNYGAIGSHMENLQRREGYKGFNQKNVSTIIKKTDPRSIL
ncbi:MAG TPA: hypothetical protein PLC42_06305 [Parachlamydiaceae bacterium]|nr:hypothetical protein [Parachlamydiaceae bacterium]